MDHQFHPLQASGTGHTGEPFPAGPDMPEGQLTALAMPLTSPEYIVHQRVQREAYGSVDPGEVAEIVEAAITADRERTSEEDRQLRADARLIREAQSAAYKAELMVLSTRLKEAEAELSTLRPQLTAAPQSHAGDAGVE
eukprot:gene26299-32240_t